jgi:uncharacterized ferritin-like protein (DUF455 family)
MEIRTFAERVLFGTTLEEKLAGPEGRLTDEDRGEALTGTPETPGRPDGLRMAESGVRAELPAERELGREEPRAVLLHCFANHELLATELMALALLRFPDAPRAFRQGLVQTLRDEQEHTRMYMERMARAGFAFGDLPVNGFFWKHVGGMESPLDYVSRLSLTFEQANLDYARHYAGVFRGHGDEETAVLLERIYEDEISHVGYGLRWLRKWKEAGDSDWEAWRRRLVFPLGPGRARGTVPFNAEGRRRAGFDEGFIASLEVFSQSRGRTPDVFWFNPGAEICALQRRAGAAGQDGVVVPLMRDLDLVPLAAACQDDVVLVQRMPTVGHLQRLKAAGIGPAEFVVMDGLGRLPAGSLLRERKLGRLRPWGWSADSVVVAAEMSGHRREPSVPWSEPLRELYSKATAAGLLAGMGGTRPEAAALAGVVVRTREEVVGAVGEWRARGFGEVVLKAPFSLAGRGMIRVREAVPLAHEAAWTDRMLGEQGLLVVEPWLERVADYSAHYDCEPGELPRLRGLVRLHCDRGGRFIACVAGRSFGRLLPEGGARAWAEEGGAAFYADELSAMLRPHVEAAEFRGWLGVDALMYREAGGRLRLRPVVEINPRCTMGRVTLELRRFAGAESVVGWRIFHDRAVRSMGYESLRAFGEKWSERFPVVMGRSEEGPERIVSGALALNDGETAERFLGVMAVGREAVKALLGDGKGGGEG